MKVNLIPLAGEGQRFKNAGYKIPKPLIEIDGIPMVVYAAKNLPKADKYIFICREEHNKNGELHRVLTDNFPDPIILNLDYLTEGQAITCMLAKNYINPDDQLTIGACDNGMIYNFDIYKNLIKEHDCIIWTFRNNAAVKNNPKMYGWVFTNENKKATKISCKNPISVNPIKDHAIVGTFSFKKARYFFECAEIMIKKNRRINNEFYNDIVLDECIKSGGDVVVFEVEKYMCWGTPVDLEKYITKK